MKNCRHCGERSERIFCCPGCKAAYHLIRSLNLGKFYEYCAGIYNSKPPKVLDVKNELDYLEHIISRDEGFEGNFLVEGIHCGSCIWLIENTLRQQKGVTYARVNLSTKRLNLKWEGEKIGINDYIKIIEKVGYRLIPFTPDSTELIQHSTEVALLKNIFVSGLATISIMMITLGIWVGNANNEITPYLRTVLHFLAAAIAVPATLYSGSSFYRSGFLALRSGYANMDVPISIGVLAALFVSIIETVNGSLYTYYDAAVTLIFFLLIGRYLDQRMRTKAKGYIRNLMLSQPISVNLITPKGVKLISIAKAMVGDIIFVAAGDRIPADGIIIKGNSEVDFSLITGEALPVKVMEGSKVVAGAVNFSSPIEVRVTAVGEDTALAEIIRLIELTEHGKAKYVQIADRITRFYTPLVLALSLLTLCFWQYKGAYFSETVLYAVSVLIIACPCALGLAVPIVQVVAAARLFSKGILIKTGDAYEKLSCVDTVVFDKTGTLTLGKPTIINSEEIEGGTFKLIASIAAKSKHVLCRAIVESYHGKLIQNLKVEEIKGQGLKVYYRRKEYLLGSRQLCKVGSEASDYYLEMWFKEKGEKPKRIIFEDELRPDAREVINWLNENGYYLYLLSGDRRQVVQQVANEINIKNAFGEVHPGDKYDFIKRLSAEGRKVLVVGDGLNDSPSLKLAFISMSPSSGLEIAQNYADIVFHSKPLQPILEAIVVAKKSQVLIKQNFLISFIYNIITIPAAMAGYASPIMASIVMSLSSLMVLVNSLRLRK